MRATIVNCFPDHNKGSSAIAWGAANRLRGTGLVDHVDFVSLWAHMDPEVHYRHLTKAFPDATVWPSPLATRGRGERGVEHATQALRMLTRTGALRLESVRRSLASEQSAFEAIRSSDLVVERGGPFLAGMGPPPNPTLLAYSMPLVYARECGIPYALLGESIGPLTSWWSQLVVKRLVSDAVVTTLRERRSSALLDGIGMPPGSAVVSLDNAFWLEPNESCRVAEVRQKYGLVHNEFLAVTVKLFPLQEVGEYLSQVAEVIDTLVPSMFPRAALIPNLYLPGAPDQDDRAVSEFVLDRVKDRERVVFVDEDLAADEMSALYGSARVLLGTRLHSVILTLLAGGTAVAVSYGGPKTIGVMELLGLEDYVLEMQRFDVRRAVELIRRADASQPKVEERIARLRSAGDDALGSALARVAERREKSTAVV